MQTNDDGPRIDVREFFVGKGVGRDTVALAQLVKAFGDGRQQASAKFLHDIWETVVHGPFASKNYLYEHLQAVYPGVHAAGINALVNRRSIPVTVTAEEISRYLPTCADTPDLATIVRLLRPRIPTWLMPELVCLAHATLQPPDSNEDLFVELAAQDVLTGSGLIGAPAVAQELAQCFARCKQDLLRRSPLPWWEAVENE